MDNSIFKCRTNRMHGNRHSRIIISLVTALEVMSSVKQCIYNLIILHTIVIVSNYTIIYSNSMAIVVTHLTLPYSKVY